MGYGKLVYWAERRRALVVLTALFVAETAQEIPQLRRQIAHLRAVLLHKEKTLAASREFLAVLPRRETFNHGYYDWGKMGWSTSLLGPVIPHSAQSA